jgi:4'-phosphopantetheinyl transferase
MEASPVQGEQAVPAPALPPAGEAHVWAVPLRAPPVAPERLHSWLSGHERQRATRFRFEDDRCRCIVGRGMLRLVLGGCTGEPPADITLFQDEYGRPRLNTAGETGIEFNVAHSGDWIMIAVSVGCRVGVDVERFRQVAGMDSMLNRFFAAAEAAAIARLTGEARVAAFFDCWTCKEAYVKAVGGGLQIPLDSFEVECRPDHPPALLSVRGSAQQAAGWRLWRGTPAPAYRAAVATEAAVVRAWRWSAGAPPAAWPGLRSCPSEI